MKIPSAVNAVPAMLLRSPLHRVLSGKYALLSFTGRKSGRTYTTPVAYVQEGDVVYLSTDSPWGRNLEAGPPVKLRLRGRDRRGTARVATEASAAAEILRKLVDAIPSYARPAELTRENGRVPDSEIHRAVQEGRRSIAIVLAGGNDTGTPDPRQVSVPDRSNPS